MTKIKAMNLLRSIRSMAGEASLTGSLRSGAEVLINAYNEILKEANKQGWLDGFSQMFTPIIYVEEPETEKPQHGRFRKSQFGVVGCSAELLLNAIRDDDDFEAFGRRGPKHGTHVKVNFPDIEIPDISI